MNAAWYAGLLAVPAIAVLAMFDAAIIAWVAETRSDRLVRIFDRISDIGEGTEFFGMAVFVLFLGLVNRSGTRSPLPLNSAWLRDYGWLCLQVLILTGLTVLCIKVGIGRSRPDLWIDQGVLDFMPLSFDVTRDYKSFPSGHTQTAFSVAVLMSLLLPRSLHVFLYAIAALVGLSRVVLLAHWPSDVVAGALIGVLLPVLLIRRRGLTIYGSR